MLSFCQGIELKADAVVLACGHSSRDMYECLLQAGVEMSAKPFAAGFRIEHPQALIDELQFGEFAKQVERGRGKVPVADYRVTAHVRGSDANGKEEESHPRAVYSFCMCPGGQIGASSRHAMSSEYMQSWVCVSACPLRRLSILICP